MTISDNRCVFKEMVSKRTLGDIFCDNVDDMAEAQLDVFLVPAADNPKVRVKSMLQVLKL